MLSFYPWLLGWYVQLYLKANARCIASKMNRYDTKVTDCDSTDADPTDLTPQATAGMCSPSATAERSLW